MKKLKLAKQTIRVLTADALHQVAGANGDATPNALCRVSNSCKTSAAQHCPQSWSCDSCGTGC